MSQGWFDSGMDEVVGIMALATGIVIVMVIAGVVFLAYEGYGAFKKRHDPPLLGPWSEPGDVSSFGWDAGLKMGQEVVWQ